MPNGKTITTRKIDIRSPEGKLLSSTIQKTISYGKDAVLPPDPYPSTDNKPLIVEPKNECKHECKHRCCHNDEQMSERTELVDLNLTRDCGDSTLYGDKWSNASSTLKLRRSRLLPNHYPQMEFDSQLISDLIWEINARRRRNGVPLLRSTDHLMMEAQRHAERMGRDRKISLEDRMNVWIGRSPHASQIVNEWSSDMINWTHNYLKMPQLKLIGVGVKILEKCGGDPRHLLHLIVVVYD